MESGPYILKMLLVDDDSRFLSSLKRTLTKSEISDHLQLTACDSSTEAADFIKKGYFDIILTDMMMPGLSGDKLASLALEINPDCSVMIMTGFSDLKLAVNLIKTGIYDYITKPFDVSELILKLRHLVLQIRQKHELEVLRDKITSNDSPIIHESAKMESILQTAADIADTDFPVLIRGESGTGKKLIADLIHRKSLRHEEPFIKLNCAGLVASLLESEIFGHEKGAFTGAIHEKKGKFELADRGTLFLDEIGDMEMPLQAKFLRLLQQGEFQRVGGTQTLHSDVRILAATNRNLAELITQGKFREDLYYRLNTIELTLPPLRERSEDIPLLLMHFLKELGEHYNRISGGINRKAMDTLCSYDFPGNIRELQNIISHAYALARENEITLSELPDYIVSLKKDSPVPEYQKAEMSDSMLIRPLDTQVAELEERAIKTALSASGNNRMAAARLLNISRRQFYYKMEKYSIR